MSDMDFQPLKFDFGFITLAIGLCWAFAANLLSIMLFFVLFMQCWMLCASNNYNSQPYNPSGPTPDPQQQQQQQPPPQQYSYPNPSQVQQANRFTDRQPQGGRYEGYQQPPQYPPSSQQQQYPPQYGSNSPSQGMYRGKW